MPETQQEIEAKRIHIASQFREATSDPPVVTCECKRRIPLRMLFKCLYCMCYFCQACAEIHFGKTRKQFYEEKDAAAAAEAGNAHP